MKKRIIAFFLTLFMLPLTSDVVFAGNQNISTVNDYAKMKTIGYGASFMGLNYEYKRAAKGKRVIVAVLDTGVNNSLRVFKNRLVTGYDFVNEDKKPVDDNGHGTYVCGIIAESTPSNVKIMPIKVADKHGEALTSDIIYAIDYASRHGADVINVSLGGYVKAKDMKYYEKWVNEFDTPIICSAGNEKRNLNKKSVNYVPAEFKRSICVSSINKKKKRNKRANYGKAIDFVAPGEGVKMYYFRGGYRIGYGTSFSTPYVTAMSAILIAEGKKDVKIELRKRAEDLGSRGKDKYYGYGYPRFSKKK